MCRNMCFRSSYVKTPTFIVSCSKRGKGTALLSGTPNRVLTADLTATTLYDIDAEVFCQLAHMYALSL